jgi:hypothetical protein
MARPLIPISKKAVKQYEELIKSARLANNKQEEKRVKRLFLSYLKKREIAITELESNSIYKYFKEIKKPTEKEEIETELKNYVIEQINDLFEHDFSKELNDYFSNNLNILCNNRLFDRALNYINDNTEIPYNDFGDGTMAHIKEEMKLIQNRLIYLSEKKYKMRKYRQKLQLIEADINHEDENTLLHEIVEYEKKKEEMEISVYETYKTGVKILKEKYHNGFDQLLKQCKKELAVIKDYDNRIEDKKRALQLLKHNLNDTFKKV